ncbi:MAG: EAL domain-containing protein [Acidimicrobiales bacterium]|nr:EAL domain-containing protein [Acidimicrobiales bacterium]
MPPPRQATGASPADPTPATEGTAASPRRPTLPPADPLTAAAVHLQAVQGLLADIDIDAMVVTPEGYVAWASDRLRHLGGRRLDELLGGMTQRARAGLRRRLAASLSDGAPPPALETLVTGPDGAERLIHWSGRVLRGDDGRGVGAAYAGLDITRQRTAERALADRVAFQQLLTSVSARFLTLPPGEVDAGIHEALSAAAELAGADRAYLLLYGDDGTVTETHDWCRPQAAADEAAAATSSPPIEAAARFASRVARGEPFLVSGADDQPPDEADFLRGAGLRSAVVIPLRNGDRVRASVGFDAVQRRIRWSAERAEQLRTVGQLAVSALERKRAHRTLEERAAFDAALAAISTRLVDVDVVDVDRRISQALAAIGRLAGADRAYAFDVDLQRATMTNTHEWCAEGIDPVIDGLHDLPLDEHRWLLGHLAAGSSVVVSDVDDLPPSERDLLVGRGVRSLMLSPLTSLGRLVGFIGLDAVRATTTWPVERVQQLRLLGELLVNVTERQRVVGELARSEDRYRRLAEGLPDVVFRFRTRPEPGMEYVSPTAAEVLDHPVSTLLEPGGVLRHLAPDGRDALVAMLFDDTVRSHTVRVRWRRGDGRTARIEIRGNRIVDEETGTVAVEGIVRDVTEQVRADAVTRLHTDALQALLAGEPVEAVLDRVCHEVADLLCLPAIWVGTKRPEGLVAVTGRGGPLAGELVLPEIRWDGGPLSDGPAARAVATGRPQLVRADQVRPATSSHARATGLVAGFGLPLTLAGPLGPEGEPVGVLAAYADEATALDEPTLATLRDLGGWISLLLTLARGQERLRLQGAAMAAAANAIFITAPDGRIEWVNDAFTRLTGWPADEALGGTPRILRSGHHDGAYYERLWSTILAGRPFHSEVVNRRRDGTLYQAAQTVTPLVDPEGAIRHFVAIQEDVTALREAEAQLEHQALHDSLTGLPNRSLLADRLRQALTRARRHDRRVGVVHVDLDDFKVVNDVQGLADGDRLLVEVARRLEAVMRPGDTVARLGGDEFGVLCDDLADERDVIPLVERVRLALDQPRADDTTGIPATMGVAVTRPGDDTDAEALLRDADTAMHRAKARHRGRFEVFDESIRADFLERIRTTDELRRAIAEDELVVCYQPQVDLLSRALAGVEALVRWQHPERGLLAPAAFVGLAEETGLVASLDRVVLGQALAQLAAWKADPSLSAPPVLAVNVSVHTLTDPTLADDVTALLAATGVAPGELCIEVVESVVVDEGAAASLDRIAALGVGISIDDFGRGYSSLGYLRHLPVSLLKIDQSFVADLSRSEGAHAIVAAAVELGHGLGLRVLAEGVETPVQAEALSHLGCDLAQGFLLSRPLHIDALTEVIRSARTWHDAW